MIGGRARSIERTAPTCDQTEYAVASGDADFASPWYGRFCSPVKQRVSGSGEGLTAFAGRFGLCVPPRLFCRTSTLTPRQNRSACRNQPTAPTKKDPLRLERVRIRPVGVAAAGRGPRQIRAQAASRRSCRRIRSNSSLEENGIMIVPASFLFSLICTLTPSRSRSCSSSEST